MISLSLRIFGLFLLLVLFALLCAFVYRWIYPASSNRVVQRVMGGRETKEGAFTKALISNAPRPASPHAIPPTPVTRQLLELDPIAVQTDASEECRTLTDEFTVGAEAKQHAKRARKKGGCCNGLHLTEKGCPIVIGRSTYLYEEIGMPREIVGMIVEYAPACCLRSRISLLPSLMTQKFTAGHLPGVKLRSLPYEKLRYLDECPSTTLNYLRWLVCALSAVRHEFGAQLSPEISYDYENDSTDTTEAKLWIAASHSPAVCLYVEILLYEATELNHRIGAPEIMTKAVKDIIVECDEVEVAKRSEMCMHHDAVGGLMAASAFPKPFEWNPILNTYRCSEHDHAAFEDFHVSPSVVKRWPFSYLIEARLEALCTRIASKL